MSESKSISELGIDKSLESTKNWFFKEKSIEEKVEYIKNQLSPHINTINKLRKKYPNKEIGGVYYQWRA